MYRHHWIGLWILLAWAVVVPTQAQPANDADANRVEIFCGQLIKGWHTGGWNGIALKPMTVEENQPGMLKLTVGKAAKNWGGAFLSTIQPTEKTKHEIQLTEKIKQAGYLVMQVNGSEDEWGNHVGQQKIQINIAQREAKSKWKHGSKFLHLSKYLQDGKIDQDATTWQQVRIPMTDLLAKESLPAMGAVFFQYIGEPASSVLIRDLHIAY
ncbi:MAG TPA: hypothetical protein DER01_21525 [Phycisphaerales bacterium]|nr:hypothetical protein [Phycisphaerales bacterium]